MGKKFKFFLAMFSLIFFGIPNFVFAQQSLEARIMGQVDSAVKKTEWKAGNPGDPRLLVAQVIEIILSLLGIVFVILMILGGYRRLTARGDEEKVKKADQTILAAVVGLAIVLLSYAITDFVAKRVYEAAIEGQEGGYELQESGPAKYEWNVPILNVSN